MKPESSIAHPRPAIGATPALAARANAKAQDKAAVPFASQVDAGAPSHVPPAQAARAALEARPDLACRPFSAIVSLFARHLELPAAAEPAPAEPPAGEESEVAEEPAAEPAVDQTATDIAAGDGLVGGDQLTAGEP